MFTLEKNDSGDYLFHFPNKLELYPIFIYTKIMYKLSSAFNYAELITVSNKWKFLDTASQYWTIAHQLPLGTYDFRIIYSNGINEEDYYYYIYNAFISKNCCLSAKTDEIIKPPYEPPVTTFECINKSCQEIFGPDGRYRSYEDCLAANCIEVFPADCCNRSVTPNGTNVSNIVQRIRKDKTFVSASSPIEEIDKWCASRIKDSLHIIITESFGCPYNPSGIGDIEFNQNPSFVVPGTPPSNQPSSGSYAKDGFFIAWSPDINWSNTFIDIIEGTNYEGTFNPNSIFNGLSHNFIKKTWNIGISNTNPILLSTGLKLQQGAGYLLPKFNIAANESNVYYMYTLTENVLTGFSMHVVCPNGITKKEDFFDKTHTFVRVPERSLRDINGFVVDLKGSSANTSTKMKFTINAPDNEGSFKLTILYNQIPIYTTPFGTIGNWIGQGEPAVCPSFGRTGNFSYETPIIDITSEYNQVKLDYCVVVMSAYFPNFPDNFIILPSIISTLVN